MKNIIRKILKEEFEWFESEDFEPSPAQQFLYEKFMECELIGSEKKPGFTKYIDKTGKILFIDNIETKKYTILYFDYYKIYWELLKMGLNYGEIKVLVKDMLDQTHKRKVLTAETVFESEMQSIA